MGGGGGFGGGGLGGAGGGVRGEASAQAAVGRSSEAGASESQVFSLANGDPSETADSLPSWFLSQPLPTAAADANDAVLLPRWPWRSGRQCQHRCQWRRPDGEEGPRAGDTKSTQLVSHRDSAEELDAQIVRWLTELEYDKERKEIVGVYDTQNAQPQDAYNNLRDLFNRSNSTRRVTIRPHCWHRTVRCISARRPIRKRRVEGRAPGLAEVVHQQHKSQ